MGVVKASAVISVLAIALMGTASAAFTPQQLLQLIQKPTSIKATDAGLNHLDGGISAMYWAWGDPLQRGVKLTRLNNNPAAWLLELSSQAYLISKIAPQRQLLATINHPAGARAFDLYLIKSGVFRGQYLQQQRFSDGRLNLAVVTKTYAAMAMRANEVQRGGPARIYSHPLGTYLFYKSTFCTAPGTLCR